MNNVCTLSLGTLALWNKKKKRGENSRVAGYLCCSRLASVSGDQQQSAHVTSLLLLGLSLQAQCILVQFVSSCDDSRVRLITSLRNNQIGELLSDIHVGLFQ